jgi:GT2 family glycosyltransferase
MISVVMPTYNEGKALPHTLRALDLQQGEFEVIVSDGGSGDGTHVVLSNFGFQCPSPLTPVVSGFQRPGLANECRNQTGKGRVVTLSPCAYGLARGCTSTAQ